MFPFAVESVMIVLFWSLIAGIISLLLSAFSHTCRIQTSSCLHFVVLTAKMFPVQFLAASSSLVCSVPLDITDLIFLLLYTFLTFTEVISLPYCSIQDQDFFTEFYVGQNNRYS
jgi:hypothetical protein